MGGVDVPDTPVGVVVAVGAGTEGALSPKGCCLPVVIVMARKGLGNIFNSNLSPNPSEVIPKQGRGI